MTVDESADSSKLEKFIDLGADIVSAPPGPLIGMTLGGIPGAVVGSIVAPVMSWAISEMMHRTLSRREEVRLSAVMRVAANRLEELVAEGVQLRNDGFWDDSDGERTSAEEVIEGLLLAVQREHEESKIPYIANLWANIAVTTNINRAYANWLVKTASDLTFTQLQLLALFAKGEQQHLRTRPYVRPDGHIPEGTEIDVEHLHLLDEVADLWNRELIRLVPRRRAYVTPYPLSVIPAQMEVYMRGVPFVQLLELHSMPESDYRDVLERLAWNGDFPVLPVADDSTAN